MSLPERLLIAALAFLVLTILATGRALPADAAPTGAPPAASQELADATVAWVSDELLYPFEVPPLRAVTAAELGPESVAEAWPTELRVMRWLDLQIGRLGAGKPDGWWSLLAGHYLLHEVAHYACTDCDYSTPEARAIEEGFADAVALDLLPAWSRQVAFGADYSTQALRPAEVANIRATSAVATGSRTWRSRAARLWRRRGLLGPQDVRAAMLQEAAELAAARSSR